MPVQPIAFRNASLMIARLALSLLVWSAPAYGGQMLELQQVPQGLQDLTERATPTFGVIYEAENAFLSGPTVENENPGYTGTGYADFQNPDYDYISWYPLNVPAGDYVLEFRYALSSGDRPLRVGVNGHVIVEGKSFPASGSWTTWTTVGVVVSLNQELDHVWLGAIGDSGPNIDHLKIKEYNGPQISPELAADLPPILPAGELGEAEGSDLPLAIVSPGEESSPEEEVSLDDDFFPTFRRGDGNSDGKVDLSDTIKILGYLFLGDDAPGCMEAANANDDHIVDQTDATMIIASLYLGGAEIPSPGPAECGIDPTAGEVGCEHYPEEICD